MTQSETSNDTITITMDDNYTFDIDDLTVDTIDISSIAASPVSTITLEDSHWADSIVWEQTEFEDTMPSVAKVEDMCKDYPALAQAYENFKTIYTLVHQDWKGKNDKDEELPF